MNKVITCAIFLSLCCVGLAQTPPPLPSTNLRGDADSTLAAGKNIYFRNESSIKFLDQQFAEFGYIQGYDGNAVDISAGIINLYGGSGSIGLFPSEASIFHPDSLSLSSSSTNGIINLSAGGNGGGAIKISNNGVGLLSKTKITVPKKALGLVLQPTDLGTQSYDDLDSPKLTFSAQRKVAGSTPRPIRNFSIYWNTGFDLVFAIEEDGKAEEVKSRWADGERMQFGDGTLAGPAYSFLKDQKLGLYRKSDGVLGIAVPNGSASKAVVLVDKLGMEVDGRIRTKEVVVETAGFPFPDFVFAPGYALPSLAETEQHIAEHGHLPGIPTAAEVAENGVSIGELQIKLLQKMEEMTLHQIAMEKRVQAVEKENQELRSQLSTLATP